MNLKTAIKEAGIKLPIKAESYGYFFDANSEMVCECDYSRVPLYKAIESILNEKPIENKCFKFNLPVTYKPTKITDATGVKIVTIRGWGRLGKLPNGAELQDNIGVALAERINSEAIK